MKPDEVIFDRGLIMEIPFDEAVGIIREGTIGRSCVAKHFQG